MLWVVSTTVLRCLARSTLRHCGTAQEACRSFAHASMCAHTATHPRMPSTRALISKCVSTCAQPPICQLIPPTPAAPTLASMCTASHSSHQPRPHRYSPACVATRGPAPSWVRRGKPPQGHRPAQWPRTGDGAGPRSADRRGGPPHPLRVHDRVSHMWEYVDTVHVTPTLVSPTHDQAKLNMA